MGADVGTLEGNAVGSEEGSLDGDTDGSMLGATEGVADGAAVGLADGPREGMQDGLRDGATLGLALTVGPEVGLGVTVKVGAGVGGGVGPVLGVGLGGTVGDAGFGEGYNVMIVVGACVGVLLGRRGSNLATGITFSLLQVIRTLLTSVDHLESEKIREQENGCDYAGWVKVSTENRCVYLPRQPTHHHISRLNSILIHHCLRTNYPFHRRSPKHLFHLA